MRGTLESGAAAEAFERMVAALGGPADFLARAAALLPRAGVVVEAAPERGGIVTAIDVRAIGLAVVELGGGRARAADAIDPSVGLTEAGARSARRSARTAAARSSTPASADSAEAAVATPARRLPPRRRARPAAADPVVERIAAGAMTILFAAPDMGRRAVAGAARHAAAAPRGRRRSASRSIRGAIRYASALAPSAGGAEGPAESEGDLLARRRRRSPVRRSGAARGADRARRRSGPSRPDERVGRDARADPSAPVPPLRAPAARKNLGRRRGAAEGRRRDVGVLGLGVLGTDAATKLEALGFRGRGLEREAKGCVGRSNGSTARTGCGALLARTDMLVVLLPLTPDDARAA